MGDFFVLENKDKDDLLSFSDKFVDKGTKNIVVNDRADAVDELSCINHASVCVMTNLGDLIVEKICDNSK